MFSFSSSLPCSASLDIKSFHASFVLRSQGKPTSRIRPEFVIYDPHRPLGETTKVQQPLNKSAELLAAAAAPAPAPAPSRFQQLLSPALQRKFRRHRGLQPSTSAGDSDSETDESCVSTPRLQRKLAGKRQPVYRSAPCEINDPKSSHEVFLKFYYRVAEIHKFILAH